MRRAFQLSATIDEGKSLIIFRIVGEIDSPRLIDKWIETYNSLAEPWRYSRLSDFRRSSGIVEFDDLARFDTWWRERTQGKEHVSKIAIIVNNPLDQVRINVAAKLSPQDIRKSFTNLDEALDWLSSAD